MVQISCVIPQIVGKMKCSCINMNSKKLVLCLVLLLLTTQSVLPTIL